MSDARVLQFHDHQGEMRDDILRIVHGWTPEERGQAVTNGEAAVLIAKGLVERGYRKVAKKK